MVTCPYRLLGGRAFVSSRAAGIAFILNFMLMGNRSSMNFSKEIFVEPVGALLGTGENKEKKWPQPPRNISRKRSEGVNKY